MKYVAIDGDNTGRKIEKALIEGNEREVVRLSKEVTNIIRKTTNHLSNLGFEVLFSAGDSILCKSKTVNVMNLSNYLSKEDRILSFSAGIGNNLKETLLALRYAKSIGESTIVQHNENDKLELIN